MTDYKKYSLGQIEGFLYDAMSTDATPQEIYDVIKGVVQDNYYTYKVQTAKAKELLALLNGNGTPTLEEVLQEKEYYEPTQKTCNKDDISPECKDAWNDFWEEHQQYTDEELDAMCDAAEKTDKVKKWILPVEADDLNGEYFIIFPDDLLEAARLKEGDQVYWIDQGDGSFKLIKTENINGTI
ncbi:hypothetical protein EB001_05100 [bacterium]|nr:hypothetical protein [bacterium]